MSDPRYNLSSGERKWLGELHVDTRERYEERIGIKMEGNEITERQAFRETLLEYGNQPKKKPQNIPSFPKLTITPEIEAEAEHRIKKNRNFISSKRNVEGEKGFIAGMFAEVIIEKWMSDIGHPVTHTDLPEYDYLLYGIKIEAKGKTRGYYDLKNHFNMTIYQYQLKIQDVDLYIHAQCMPCPDKKKNEIRPVDGYKHGIIVGGVGRIILAKHGTPSKARVIDKTNGSFSEAATIDVPVGNRILPVDLWRIFEQKKRKFNYFNKLS